jgi:hypothetical protein
MNEQIRELALQAGGSHYPDVNSAQLVKFTELVVRKCLDFIEKDAANAPDNSETQAALLACALDIVDHFDIELN